MAEGRAAVGVRHRSPANGGHGTRTRLDRHSLPYDFHWVDTVEGRELLRQANSGTDRLPLVVVLGSRILVQPTNAEVAAALGARTCPGPGRYDLAVVGAGPAGLSAAVYAASGGLRTVVIEREVFGGQAGTNSRIRNYGRRLGRGPTAETRRRPMSRPPG
jgi:thioredoxin reductase (NADPH)